MSTVIVRTKEELKNAVESKAERIVVKGELAEKLNHAIKIKKSTIAAFGLPICCAPFTGGFSVLAAPAFTGLEIGLIIAIFFIGLVLLVMVCKDFNKVKFTARCGDIEAELELERNAAAC